MLIYEALRGLPFAAVAPDEHPFYIQFFYYLHGSHLQFSIIFWIQSEGLYAVHPGARPAVCSVGLPGVPVS